MMKHQSITEKIQERKAHFVSWTFLPETDTIKVSCRNPFAELGEVIREREIQCNVAQLKLWAEGESIQVAMPKASPEDREFLISGCTPEDWDAMFPMEDE